MPHNILKYLSAFRASSRSVLSRNNFHAHHLRRTDSVATMTSNSVSLSSPPWWKESVIYQIYPASFYCQPGSPCPPNSRDQAVGNIRGLISKIPYIASLGFDCLWLSPIFSSPQYDMGYDISDYRDIYRPYGTVEDVQKLVDALHKTVIPEPRGPGRNMRLLMDLVVNHTSSEHPWFTESASSTSNPKATWYFWRDPKIDPATGERAEPNNWRSIFGGPAWHYVEARKQYYLALFLPSQPDLNWENTDMRAAIYEDMRFWLDCGVDGWRIDSMNLMSKHPDLPDAEVTDPGEKYQDGKVYYASGPKMHDYLQEMRREVFDRYGERMFTVGEMGSVETEESVAKYVAKEREELNCVFQGMDMDFGPGGKYDGSDPFRVSKLRDITNKWQVAMPTFEGWNSIYLDNHDSGRSLSRYASSAPEFRALSAKMIATYLCTLSGTVFALAGQEIGMANLPKEIGIEGYSDVEGINWYNKVLKERDEGADMSDVMEQLQLKARDHGRLPVQWNDQVNAGFCDSNMKPWMTINPDYKEWNIESQIGKEGSVLEYWKEIIKFRRQHADALVHGTFEMLSAAETGADVVGYVRATESKKLLVLLSFSQKPVSLSGKKYAGWIPLIGNAGEFAVGEELTLTPYQAIILSNQQ